MSNTKTERVREAEPIKCAHGTNPYSVSFLKILRDGDRLRVMPTSLGKQKLPRFWQVWLEDLILSKTASRQQFGVSIDNHHLLVDAKGVTPDGLYATVKQLCAQIHPIKYPVILPLEHEGHHKGTGRAYFWRHAQQGVRVDIDRVQGMLPRGSNITNERFAGKWDNVVKLVCHGALPRPQHTKLQVEYWVALDFEKQLRERKLTTLART